MAISSTRNNVECRRNAKREGILAVESPFRGGDRIELRDVEPIAKSIGVVLPSATRATARVKMTRNTNVDVQADEIAPL